MGNVVPLTAKRAEHAEQGQQMVLLPRPIYQVISRWPDVMDRIRYRAPAILPMSHAGSVADARVTLTDAGRALPEDAVLVPVPSATLRTVLDWLPTLRRGRTAGVGMSQNEQTGLEAVARFLELV